MTGKKSIIVSLASALLLLFIATLFVPAFSNNVFATEDTYIISSDLHLHPKRDRTSIIISVVKTRKSRARKFN